MKLLITSSKTIEESEKKKTINNNNIGHKETEGKLPMYTVIVEQFALALEEIAKLSVIGHESEKYKEHDEDWQNFARVPDGLNHYKNAAMRHALKGEINAVAWNALAYLELERRANLKKEKERSLVCQPELSARANAWDIFTSKMRKLSNNFFSR